MRVSRLRLAALALTSGLVLGGCAYGFGDPYGPYGGVGVGYGNYGYGNYGYGYGDPYGGYGYGGYPYGGYGYGGYPYGGYGSSIGYGYGGYPFGWNDGWYYPGSGYYVYDRDRHRRQITDAERQYWRNKFHHSGTTTTTGTTTATTTTSVAPRENWSGFNRIRGSVDTNGRWNRASATTSSDTTTRGSERSRWNRSSATTTSSDTTTTRSDNGRRGRNHDHSNEQ